MCEACRAGDEVPVGERTAGEAEWSIFSGDQTSLCRLLDSNVRAPAQSRPAGTVRRPSCTLQRVHQLPHRRSVHRMYRPYVRYRRSKHKELVTL